MNVATQEDTKRTELGRTMKKTSIALLSVPLVVSILLTACAGATQPDTSPSTITVSSPTSTTSTSATPTPSQIVDPDIPIPARSETTAGAEAYARYFFAQLNRSWSTADPSLLKPLSESGCKTCNAFTGSAASFRSKNQHYKGEVFSVSSVSALGKGLKGQEVLVVGKQKPGSVVDRGGNIVKTSVTQAGKFVVSLRWAGGRWSTLELQVQR